jgi:uncharacterized membrane protein
MDQRRRELPSHPTAANIHAIVEVERQAHRHATLSERLGKAISDAVGTMLFVTAHTAAMAAWIAWNALAPEALKFDPYPLWAPHVHRFARGRAHRDIRAHRAEPNEPPER